MTFLFDIGRVLLDFDFESSISRLIPAGTPDAGARIQKMLEKKDVLEAGKIEVDAFISWALKTLGCKATPAEFRDAWQQIFTPNEPMWRCVRQLSMDGHRLILFSNINGIHWPWICENFPEFSLFHDAVASFKTGFIKPQPEIYQYAITTHGLVPSETLYIDDLPQNCATGRTFGFRTCQYDLHNHTAFKKWLQANL